MWLLSHGKVATGEALIGEVFIGEVIIDEAVTNNVVPGEVVTGEIVIRGVVIVMVLNGETTPGTCTLPYATCTLPCTHSITLRYGQLRTPTTFFLHKNITTRAVGNRFKRFRGIAHIPQGNTEHKNPPWEKKFRWENPKAWIYQL